MQYTYISSIYYNNYYKAIFRKKAQKPIRLPNNPVGLNPLGWVLILPLKPNPKPNPMG